MSGAILLAAVFFSLVFFSVADIEFTEVPADIVIAEGDAAEFICLFTSTNPASVTWQKDGVAVIPSSRITITSSSITIDPTVEGDNGTYICIVNDQVDLTTETRSAELEFAYISNSFVISPETQTIMAGGSVVLFCLHSGSLPAADISWSKL